MTDADRLREIHPATRLLSGWGLHDCTVEEAAGRDVEGPGVFFESQARGAVVTGLSITSSSGDAGTPLVHIAGGTKGISIRELRQKDVGRPVKM
jgi:hypothetical protein